MELEGQIVVVSVEEPLTEDYVISAAPVLESGSTGILMSTRWNQSGIYNIGNNTTIRYNEYTPIDPKTGVRTLTGCTNTAAGQLIYYFIEKQNLTLTLTLDSTDGYTSIYNGRTINIMDDGLAAGTLSFAEINAYLGDFQINSAEHAAALVYACGVVQQAGYSSAATATAWNTNLFYRSGFTSVNRGGPYWNSIQYYWGSYENGKYSISDAGFEVLIENLTAGRPVGTSIPNHALVIDGYNGANDTFHINFGWGDHPATQWYTREEMQQLQFITFYYDLRVDNQETFTVTDSRVYGTGTLIRAIEQANAMEGDNRVVFSNAVAGETLELSNSISVTDDLVIENANLNLLVTKSIYHDWGWGFNLQNGAFAFNISGGALIVNTAESYNYAIYSWGEASSCTINADGALIYSGSYAVNGDYSAGAASVLQSLQNSRNTDSEVESFLRGSNFYSFSGSNEDDVFNLTGSTIAVGHVALGAGDDVISVTDHSRLYGFINSGSGNDSITVDSTSSIVGNITNNAVNLNFTLTTAEAHPIFTIEQNAYNIVYYTSVAVNMTCAEIGTYVLFSAAGTSYADSLKDLSITVTGTGNTDYVLSVNGTSTSSFADLIYENQSLKFKVKAISTVAPQVVSVTPSTTGTTNQDVRLTAAFSASTVSGQYSLDQKNWLAYESSGVIVPSNRTVYFRGLDAAGNISQVVSYTVTNIDKTAPDAPVATSDITTLTNHVTVSATFSADSVQKQYSSNNVDWSTYTSGIVMGSNGTVYFRGIDAAGNISEVTSYAVTNIDNTPPDVPVASADITTPTNQAVTVSAAFSADTVQKQYSRDNVKWSTYTSGIVMHLNGTVYFRGIDAAGNISEVTSYAVTNIDVIPPNWPTISADITTPTNKNVTVSATFSADSVQRQYSKNNLDWFDYTSGIVMESNGTVYFRGIDAAGNISTVVSYNVFNINKTAPDAPTAKANISSPTRKNVTVSATFSTDSVQKQYSFDNSVWNAYTSGIVMSSNGTVYFRGIDAAGNISDVTSYAVSNIDKTAPDAPVASADITGATNQNVTVSAVFSADSVQQQYSRNNLSWNTYTSGIVMSSNGTVYFRGIDAAGNISGITSYAVTNIDKTAPDAPVASADITGATNQNVTVSAVFSADSVQQQYSRNNVDWNAYTSGVVMSSNGTVYFRGISAAGNISAVTSYGVTNIDKIAPNAPTVTADITTSTSLAVTVSAAFSTDSVQQQYSLDNSVWSSYTTGVVMESNGTVYFRGIDAAGNISAVTSYAVTNIDKATLAPTIVIADDETNNWSTLSAGNILLVQSGGTLHNASLQSGAVSVEFEAGAILSGTISAGCNITTGGVVISTSLSSFDFNLSGRSDDDGAIVDNLEHIELTNAAVTVTVDSDQDKGTYILAGNAADFSKAITVKNTSGAVLGTISATSMFLNHQETRYVLSHDQDGSLVFTVKSNLNDDAANVFLYTGETLFASYNTPVGDLSVSSSSDISKIYVGANGEVSNINIGNEGVLELASGAIATGITLLPNTYYKTKGAINATFNKDDGTIISGTFNGESFTFANNLATNLIVQGDLITVNDGVTVNGLWMHAGTLRMESGSVLTGVIRNTNSPQISDNTVYVTGAAVENAVYSTENERLSAVWNIQQSTVNASTLHSFYYVVSNSSIKDSTLSHDNYTSLTRSTLDNVSFSGKTLNISNGNSLLGDLKLNVNTVNWNQSLNANGHTIILDLREKEESSSAMLKRDRITNAGDFTISVSSTQRTGRYAIATNYSSLTDNFNLAVDGVIIAVLNGENRQAASGNWEYQLTHDQDGQLLYLDISLSSNTSDDFRTWKHLADGTIEYADSFSGLAVNSTASADAVEVTVWPGGRLTDSTVTDGGTLTVIGGISTGMVIEDGRNSNASTRDNPIFNQTFQQDDGTVLSGVYWAYDGSNVQKSYDYSFSNNAGSNIVVTAGSSVSVNRGVTIDGIILDGNSTTNKRALLSLNEDSVLTGTVTVFSENANLTHPYTRIHLNGAAVSNAGHNGIATEWSAYNATIEGSQILMANYQDQTAYSGNDSTNAVNGYSLGFWGSTISNTTFNSLEILPMGGNILSNVELSGRKFVFVGSYKDPTGNTVTASTRLDGTLTLKADIFDWGTTLLANGNRIILDLSEKTVNDPAMLVFSRVSEDALFTINVRENQAPGKYAVGTKYGNLIDDFSISINNETIGILNADNLSAASGSWVYTLVHDPVGQTLDLEITLSPDAGDDLRAWKYHSDGTSEHAAAYDGLVIGTGAGADAEKAAVFFGGSLTNSTIAENGMFTLYRGGTVTGLTLSNNAIFNATISKDDGTLLSGTFGGQAFSVANNAASDLVVTEGSTITVEGITVDNALLKGHTTQNGYGDGGARLYARENSTLTGNISLDYFDDRIYVYDSNIRDASIDGGNTHGAYIALLSRDSTIENTNIIGCANLDHNRLNKVSLECGYADINSCILADTTLTVSVRCNIGTTYSDQFGIYHTENSRLDGFLELVGNSGIVTDPTTPNAYNLSAIDGNGNDVIINLAEQTPNRTTPLVSGLNNLFNTELILKVNADQVPGTYKVARDASQFGQGHTEGVWDFETNSWQYVGNTRGDLDGIVDIRDNNGILLAQCTVNGETEYSGRYNYTVSIDADGIMSLVIGVNSRDGLSFAADGYDNDTLNTAAVLTGTAGSLNGLTIDSPSDVDFYKFTMSATGRAASEIGIDFKMWKGDLDLFLYDSDGDLVRSAKSVTDNETISLHRLAAGDYYLKVAGYDGNTNAYSLHWNLPNVSQLVDNTENGNDKEHCTELGQLAGKTITNAAISSASDQDWFSFFLTEDGTSMDSISITFDNAEADLDLRIYGANGIDLIGRGTKTADDAFTVDTVSLAGFKHGKYYVQVVSSDGGAADYSLTSDIGSTDIAPDGWENNNFLTKAANLYSIDGDRIIDGLSIHNGSDVDYYKFTILEDGSADDYISIEYEARLGDLDLDILDADGNTVVCSHTAENMDKVSLSGLAAGNYFVKVSGYNNDVNNYTLNYHYSNSSLIASDVYEGIEAAAGAISIRQNQTVKDLSIGAVRRSDETRADKFKITLDYDAWNSTKLILTDYRSDWDGLSFVLSSDAEGNDVLKSGVSSEISLAGMTAGEYYLTLDTPVDGQYSEYSIIAQRMPDSEYEIQNNWSIFVYMAGDNNLEDAYLSELLYMQQAILPEDVEVYVLLDRHDGYSDAQRDWTGTRVGKIRHSNAGAILSCPTYREKSLAAVAVEWMYFDGLNTDTYVTASNLELETEWDTGSIATLEAFLDWGMQAGRADNYALIMKDHGSSLGFNSTDEKSGSIMSISDISDLLKNDKYENLSVVAFDQCQMGSDVVITEMENAVQYTVASEAIGYTPNQLMMYKVLFNSLESDMTPLQLAEKMVASCNTSGTLNLTLAAFDTGSACLSTALNDFASHVGDFTYSDWTAIRTSFGTAFNYGNDICAFSDLIGIMKEIRNFNISTTLENALNELIETVNSEVIQATQITPASYGTGLAVYNPVLSSDRMNQYCFGSGAYLDYSATSVGQTSWGHFLYTVGALTDDTEGFMNSVTNRLTFSDFDYSCGLSGQEIVINLGAFSGSGMNLDNLYVAEKAVFSFEMLQSGIEDDAIRITADNPSANISAVLVQSVKSGNDIEKSVVSTSENGILSLAGIDHAAAGAYSNYELVITADQATSYSMRFDGNWTSGVDRFDFAHAHSIDSGKGGNNIIDKATFLAPGNYAGLMTYSGDADFYHISSVYADKLDVTVSGADLTVSEYDAAGNLIQNAAENDGFYTLKVQNGNYLYIEGNANISANEVNSYSLTVSDVSHTYLEPAIGGAEPPELSVVQNTSEPAQQVIFTATTSDGIQTYWSTNLTEWTSFQNEFTVTENGLFFFKAVDPVNNLESKYITRNITNIDNTAPVITLSADNTTPARSVTLTAGTEDGLTIYYSTDNTNWTAYSQALNVTANGTYYFKATDAAGNTGTADISFDNIDDAAPVITLTGNNTTPAKSASLTASTETGLTIYYSTDNETWTEYTQTLNVTANATYYFKATDAVGNTGTADITFHNIDNTAPSIILIGDNMNLAQSSTLTAITETGLSIYYSTDNATWTVYTETLDITANGTYYFKATDAAGNTGTANISFNNIDNTAPVITLTGNNTTPAQSASLTASTETGLTIYYSTDNTNWTAYTQALNITSNGTYYFKATDAAGNTGTANISFNNIDNTAPVITLTGNNTTPARSASLTASTETGLTIYYSTDNTNWTAYTQALNVTSNATYYFKATDAAGNTGTANISFNNIDNTAPVITLTGNNTTPAQSVSLTASTETGLTIYYSTDNTNWTAYTQALNVTSNATYYFKTTDAAGNTGTANISFNNIDNAAPVITLTGNNTTPARSASLTASTETGLTIYYSTDNTNWTAYTQALNVTANATYYFKTTDAAGNTGTKQILFANIDRTAPTAPTVEISTTAETNQDITLTATYSTDTATKQYSTDNNTWNTYTAAISAGANGTWYFRGIDAAGNISEVTSFTVSNIDKVAPAKPTASANTTSPTNQNVTVTATFSDDSAVREYSLDGRNFLAYGNGVVMENNGSVYFRGTDAAGNSSEVTSFTVNNIDKVAPTKPTASANTTSPTNQNVTVTAAFSDDSAVREYSLDGRNFLAYGNGVVMENNGSVYFRGTDAAGNSSEVTSFTVSNIDKVAPAKPTASANITSPTNQNVTVTATFSNDSAVREYSLDGRNFLAYGNGVVMENNGSVYFRGTDAAGNSSEVTSFTVNNIDKVAPAKPTASANTTSPTNQNVTVTAAFSDDSVVREYSLDGQNFLAYENGVVMENNGTAYFRGTDAAGNVSEIASYTVSNIITALPDAITSDLNADGRADVIMSITEEGHGAEGATGAWLILEDQTAAWGDLSTRNPGWEIFGTGKTAAGKNTDDVYIKSTGNIIGAWTTGDDGKVNGWETIGEFSSDTQIIGLGDFNANGQADLLLRNTNGAVGCFFTSGPTTGWNYFQSLGDEWKLTAVGDLNGDGRDDVVLKHDAGFAGSWLTQEDGTMAWADLDTLPEGFAIIGAGDFNGDGTDDVLLKSGNYYGAWLVNNGNAAGWMGLGDLGDVTVEQIADFNGDGKDDLRIRTAAGDLGTQLVMGEDNLVWKYYGSVGSEWSTSLAALA